MTSQVPTQKKQTYSIPKEVKQPILFSWGISFSILLVSIIYYFISQPELPMFYSLARKTDQLVPKVFLFIFPLISFVMNFVHILFIKALKNYSLLLLKLFVGATLALQLILTLALFRIILITI